MPTRIRLATEADAAAIAAIYRPVVETTSSARRRRMSSSSGATVSNEMEWTSLLTSGESVLRVRAA